MQPAVKMSRKEELEIMNNINNNNNNNNNEDDLKKKKVSLRNLEIEEGIWAL